MERYVNMAGAGRQEDDNVIKEFAMDDSFYNSKLMGIFYPLSCDILHCCTCKGRQTWISPKWVGGGDIISFAAQKKSVL